MQADHIHTHVYLEVGTTEVKQCNPMLIDWEVSHPLFIGAYAHLSVHRIVTLIQSESQVNVHRINVSVPIESYTVTH